MVKQFGMKLYTGCRGLKIALLGMAVVLYALPVVLCGGSLLELLHFALVLCLYIIVPGVLFAYFMKADNRPQGYFGPVAILLGTGFLCVLYAAAMLLGAPWLLQLLPLLLALAVVIPLNGKGTFKKLARKAGAVRLTPRRWLLVLLWAGLLVMFSAAGVIKSARPLAAGDVLISHDLLWNVGNANAFTLGFPPVDIRFAGVPLRYHFLTELVAAALSMVSGISTYNIIAFYMQPFMLAGLVLCLWRFGRLVFKTEGAKAMLFCFSMFIFSCASLWKVLPNGASVFGNSNIQHLITNINSQTTAFIALSIFSGLFVNAARHRYKVGLTQSLLVVAAFAMLAVAKGPLAALVAAGVLLTLLFGLFQRCTGWRGVLLGAGIAAVFALAYVMLFSGGAQTSMPFSLTGTLEGGYFKNILARLHIENKTLWYIAIPVLWVVQSCLAMPAAFPLYVRGLLGDVRRLPRLEPERLFFNAVAVGGLLAYFCFNHPHGSQVYFLFTALFFIHLLAVDATRYLRLVPSTGAQKTAHKVGGLAHRAFVAIVALLAAVGAATALLLYVHLGGSGARQLARIQGWIPKYPYDVVMNADDEAAMLWLQQNSAPSDMFTTNRIHTGARLEGISNLYSAFSSRQAFMEGFQFTVTNMGVSKEEVARRLAVYDQMFMQTTPPEQVVQLCRENSIRFVVFSSQLPGTEDNLTELQQVYTSPTVRIYQCL